MDSFPPDRRFLDDGPSRSAARRGYRSNRFLGPEDCRPRIRTRAWGSEETFAEGQWQLIRVTLERQGWSGHQIELVHEQLRQGWPLVMAKANVAAMTGCCPLRSRPDG